MSEPPGRQVLSKENPHTHHVDKENVEMNHPTEPSQRKDPVEEGTNGKDVPDQSRPVPVVPSSRLEDHGQGVCETPPDPLRELKDLKPRKPTLDARRKAGVVERSTKKADDMLTATQRECEILRTRVLELQKNLQDAQDFIFTLQPRRQRLTETEAAADFNTLCGSIEEFVDSKLGEALDDRLLPKEKSVPLAPAELLLSLIPYPARETFKYPETDKYNVTAAILRFLCKEVFEHEFYCPGPGETEFMVSVERSMRNLEPGRDILTCRTWRSETYTAIVNRPQFARLREKRKELLTRDLTAMLGLFIPPSRTDKTDNKRALLHTAVRNNIIELACAFAHKIHLAVDHFSIEWSDHYSNSSDLLQQQQHHAGQQQPQLNPQSTSSLAGNFNSFDFVDLFAGGKKLKALPPPNSGTTINYVLDVTPQLVFRMVKPDTYDEPKVLKKPKLLVALTKEGGFDHFVREHASRLERDATVLGWVHATLLHQGAKNGGSTRK